MNESQPSGGWDWETSLFPFFGCLCRTPLRVCVWGGHMAFMWGSEHQFPQTGLFSASTGDSGNQVSDSGGPACRTETLTYSCQLEGRF